MVTAPMTNPQDTQEYLLGALNNKVERLLIQNEKFLERQDTHTAQISALERDSFRTKLFSFFGATFLISKDHLGPAMALLFH